MCKSFSDFILYVLLLLPFPLNINKSVGTSLLYTKLSLFSKERSNFSIFFLLLYFRISAISKYHKYAIIINMAMLCI